MRFWLHIHNTEPEQILDLALFAEELGFEGIMDGDHWAMPVRVTDHLSDAATGKEPLPTDSIFPDNFVVAGMVAAVTRRIKFASSVIILANRNNPFLVAKAASTVAIMGGHRLVLGVAGGWMKEEYDLAGIEWSTRVARLEEMIEVLRTLWRPGPVEFHGRFFDFGPLYSNPTPAEPIPICIGGTAPAALKRAGRIGNGWMGTYSSLAELPMQIETINQARREAGRDHLAFEFIAGVATQNGAAHTPDDFKRAADLGLTATILGPLQWVVGRRTSSLDEKKRALDRFAAQFMQ